MASIRIIILMVRDSAYFIYAEYIFIKAACLRNMLPTAFATLKESCPSASDSCKAAAAFIKGAAATSSAGKKLSLWKENNASTPLKTILRSDVGTTVSLPDPLVSVFTGSEPGLM
jgi:hypothetical protein